MFLGRVIEISGPRVRFAVERIYTPGQVDDQIFRLRTYEITSGCDWYRAKIGDRDIFFVRQNRDVLTAFPLPGLRADEDRIQQALRILSSRDAEYRR